MATHTENLLKAILSPNADYATKQLIKNGQLCEAATKTLQARRRSLMWKNVIFFSIVGVPILVNLIVTIANRIDGTTPTSVGLNMFPLIALIGVPIIIEAKASITRLETILTMWLIEDTERQNGTIEDLVEILS